MTANISLIHDRQFVRGTAPIEGESQELVDILQKIVQNASALLEVNSCSLALLDATGTNLVTLAALYKHGRKPRHSRFQLSEGVAGWVAEHREPLILNDVNLDPRFKRLGRIPVGSMACVPLIDKDDFVGTLTVSSPDINAFSERKLKMLTIFAEQAVVAITNARQAELAHHQTNQLEMLLDLSRGITTLFDADSLYRTILTDIRRLVTCQRAVIYLYHERIQELSSVAELVDDVTLKQDAQFFAVKSADVRGENISLHSATSLAAWAAVHRHPMLRAPLKFLQDETTIPPTSADVAEMAAPLVSKNMLYGVVVLQRPESFTSEELRLIRNLSNMAAVALENVELFERVRTDQEQLRAILSASSDGIAIAGENACFIEANPAFGRIFGVDPEQLVGVEFMELFDGDGSSHEEMPDIERVHQVLQERQALSYIELDLHIQGVPRSVGLSITPVSANSRPLCLIMARDVTAIRDATRMKANFLSMITHELRSPLNAINGYLDLALTGIAGELNEQQREFVQRARAGSEHLYALLEDLLLVSRADAGQLRLNRELINLKDIIANAVEELELTAIDNDLTITSDIPGDFPPIYADAIRIQQVLRNLISNALRFTPSGGSVTISARLMHKVSENELTPSTDGEGRQVEIQVHDTGCGIAPEHQQRIFERFYQIPFQGAGRSGGQGLGLAIVKMIVELHGGRVRVESESGKGTTFSFTLDSL